MSNVLELVLGVFNCLVVVFYCEEEDGDVIFFFVDNKDFDCNYVFYIVVFIVILVLFIFGGSSMFNVNVMEVINFIECIFEIIFIILFIKEMC